MWWAACECGDLDAMCSHRRQARQAAGGLTLRPPFGATCSRMRVWQPQAHWGIALRCNWPVAHLAHAPGLAGGGRRVIAVTLGQRAATGAWGWAATTIQPQAHLGHGVSTHLARRPFGACARLGKWWAAGDGGHPGAACNHRRVGLQPFCSHMRIGSWRYDALDPPHCWYQSSFPDHDRPRPSKL